MKEDSLFCSKCPCAGWCDGNAQGNKEATGYEFIPDPDHCKMMFQRATLMSFNEFYRAIFTLHGSDINRDWQRFLEVEAHDDSVAGTNCRSN